MWCVCPSPVVGDQHPVGAAKHRCCDALECPAQALSPPACGCERGFMDVAMFDVSLSVRRCGRVEPRSRIGTSQPASLLKCSRCDDHTRWATCRHIGRWLKPPSRRPLRCHSPPPPSTLRIGTSCFRARCPRLVHACTSVTDVSIGRRHSQAGLPALWTGVCCLDADYILFALLYTGEFGWRKLHRGRAAGSAPSVDSQVQVAPR